MAMSFGKSWARALPQQDGSHVILTGHTHSEVQSDTAQIGKPDGHMTDSVRKLLLWAGLAGCLALSAGQAQTPVDVGDLAQAKPLGDSDQFIVCQVVPCPAGTQLNVTSLAQIRSYLARAPLQLHVVNNAALKALTATEVNHVIRDGFAAPDDGGAATYDLTTAACSAADNGLQVALKNGGCAITKPAECPVLQLWGGSGDGSTDNTTAWNAAAASDTACLHQ